MAMNLPVTSSSPLISALSVTSSWIRRGMSRSSAAMARSACRRAAELRRRHVHRHGHFGAQHVAPVPCGGDGFAQHPVADVDDQAAFFGNGDEAGGRDAAELLAFPAQQGFHTRHPAGRQIHLGLIGQPELALGQRAGRSPRSAAVTTLQPPVVKDTVGVAPELLGGIHAHVCAAHQFGRGAAVVGEDARCPPRA